MDADKFAELRRRLVHDAELSPVWKFFLDEFVDAPGFMDLGVPALVPELDDCVRNISAQLYGKDEPVRMLRFIWLGGQGFIHGGFEVGSRPGGLFFFRAEGKGLAAIPDMAPSIEVKYARFTIAPIPKAAPPRPPVPGLGGASAN